MRAVSILTYHSLDDSGSVLSVSPAAFAKQMKSLASAGLRGVSLRESLEQRSSTGQWPDDGVVVTFDDGYTNFMEHGLPVLRDCGFGATVFAVSAHVGKTNDWTSPPPGVGEWRLMEWDDLRTIGCAGIEDGAHTETHADLTTLAPGNVQRELVDCQQTLQDRLGVEVATLAYPFGKLNTAAAAAAARLFRGACTTVLRRASADDSTHLLPRIEMFYFRDTDDLAPLVTGKQETYLTLRRWGRSVKALLHA